MKLFFTHVITLASPLKIFYDYFKYQFYTTIEFTWMWPPHECDDLQTEEILKSFCSSLADISRSIKEAWWSEKSHRSQREQPSEYDL